MLKDAEPEISPRALALGTLLAALGPLFAAIACVPETPLASGSDRLLAAVVDYAPAQPPGDPLAVLTGKLCALVPLGSLALRVALATALLHGIAAAALFRAVDRVLRAQHGLRPVAASPLALALTWIAFGCGPLFPDAAHAYAAALALACVCLERLVAVEVAWPKLALGPLRSAALAFGLLVPEQPALAAVVLLAALPTLGRLLAGFALPAWNLLPLALGLPLWLHGALASGHELGLPAARTPLEALRGAFTDGATSLPAALPEPSAELIAPLALAALAVIGARSALRVGPRRRTSALWLGAAIAALGALYITPHGRGPLALALCAAAALAAEGFAPLLSSERARRRETPLAAVLAVALGLAQLQAEARRAGALERRTGAALDEPLRRALPPRAALLLDAELLSAFADFEGEEHTRPDLLAAHKPWRLGLAAAERLADARRELLPVLRAELLSGPPALEGAPSPNVVELAALAARRPLFVALAPAGERWLHAIATPHGPLHRLSTSDVGASDVELAARDAERIWTRLYARLDRTRLPPSDARLLAERHAAELAHARSFEAERLAARARERLEQLPVQERVRARLLADPGPDQPEDARP